MSEHQHSIAEQHPPAERPTFSAGYGISRDTADGLLDWQYLDEQLQRARNYWVATTRPDGLPHVAPVWGLWFDERFYFSTDATSRKARNLSATAWAAVHLESGDDVVILEGAVERVADDAVLTRFVEMYQVKYTFRPNPSDPTQAVYRLTPRTAYGWLEQDFTTTATRWRIQE